MTGDPLDPNNPVTRLWATLSHLHLEADKAGIDPDLTALCMIEMGISLLAARKAQGNVAQLLTEFRANVLKGDFDPGKVGSMSPASLARN